MSHTHLHQTQGQVTGRYICKQYLAHFLLLEFVQQLVCIVAIHKVTKLAIKCVQQSEMVVCLAATSQTLLYAVPD